MRNLLIPLDLKHGEKLLVIPFSNPPVSLKKAERKIIYTHDLKGFREVFPTEFPFPIYLPELGVLLSLDTVSLDVAKWIYHESTKDAHLLDVHKIFISNMYNFLQDENRIVSWGTIKSFEIPTNLLDIYRQGITIDFYMAPSIIVKNQVISPHRWFFISSRTSHEFSAYLNFNFGIIYLSREKLNNARKRKYWINKIYNFTEVEGLFIVLAPTGVVGAQPVKLHFMQDVDEIKELITDDKGTYFSCLMMSLNDYTSSWRESYYEVLRLNFAHPRESSSNNINIVLISHLEELPHSKYSILPFMFPLSIETSMLDKLVYQFTVKKKALNTILTRMWKFTSPQSREIIETFELFIEKHNNLLRITEENDFYHFEVVNPGVIAFLIRCVLSPSSYDLKQSATRILQRKHVLDEIKKLKKLLDAGLPNTELFSLQACRKVLKRRAEVSQKYISMYKDAYQSLIKSFDYEVY